MEKKEALSGPIVETQMTTSQDGNWFIHKTVITDIKSRKYVEKVLEIDEEPGGSSGSGHLRHRAAGKDFRNAS